MPAVTLPRGLELVVEPPVDPSCFAEAPWSLPEGDPVALYLGRFDVYQKAIDRLVALFGLLPEVRLRAVGEAAPADVGAMAEIMAGATPNVSFEAPVRGDTKLELFRSATLYVQLSRFEGFPVSVAEALTVGTPTVVARTLGIASTIRDAGAGLALDADLHRSAAQIRELLTNPQELGRLSQAGRAFAAERFTIDAVAAKYLDLFARLDA